MASAPATIGNVVTALKGKKLRPYPSGASD